MALDNGYSGVRDQCKHQAVASLSCDLALAMPKRQVWDRQLHVSSMSSPISRMADSDEMFSKAEPATRRSNVTRNSRSVALASGRTLQNGQTATSSHAQVFQIRANLGDVDNYLAELGQLRSNSELAPPSNSPDASAAETNFRESFEHIAALF